MIQETENFDKLFWSYNYPVQLWRDEDTGETSYVIYQPRKERCWNSQEDNETVPKEELDTFIDNSIKKLKKGIELLEKYKAGEIDHVYYWDED
jgi:hypothetical protein